MFLLKLTNLWVRQKIVKHFTYINKVTWTLFQVNKDYTQNTSSFRYQVEMVFRFKPQQGIILTKTTKRNVTIKYILKY